VLETFADIDRRLRAEGFEPRSPSGEVAAQEPSPGLEAVTVKRAPGRLATSADVWSARRSPVNPVCGADSPALGRARARWGEPLWLGVTPRRS
jgi:hypothetical protein